MEGIYFVSWEGKQTDRGSVIWEKITLSRLENWVWLFPKSMFLQPYAAS